MSQERDHARLRRQRPPGDRARHLPAGPRLLPEAFGREFDRLRELPALRGKIRKFGTRYFGVALATSQSSREGG